MSTSNNQQSPERRQDPSVGPTRTSKVSRPTNSIALVASPAMTRTNSPTSLSLVVATTPPIFLIVSQIRRWWGEMVGSASEGNDADDELGEECDSEEPVSFGGMGGAG